MADYEAILRALNISGDMEVGQTVTQGDLPVPSGTKMVKCKLVVHRNVRRERICRPNSPTGSLPINIHVETSSLPDVSVESEEKIDEVVAQAETEASDDVINDGDFVTPKKMESDYQIPEVSVSLEAPPLAPKPVTRSSSIRDRQKAIDAQLRERRKKRVVEESVPALPSHNVVSTTTYEPAPPRRASERLQQLQRELDDKKEKKRRRREEEQFHGPPVLERTPERLTSGSYEEERKKSPYRPDYQKNKKKDY